MSLLDQRAQRAELITEDLMSCVRLADKHRSGVRWRRAVYAGIRMLEMLERTDPDRGAQARAWLSERWS